MASQTARVLLRLVVDADEARVEADEDEIVGVVEADRAGLRSRFEVEVRGVVVVEKDIWEVVGWMGGLECWSGGWSCCVDGWIGGLNDELVD